MIDTRRPPTWLPYLESYSARIATWFADSSYRMVSLVCMLLFLGALFELCFDIPLSFQKAGCLLVALAIFFAFGEMINLRMVNSTLPAIREHYAGSPDAADHVNDLETEGAELEEANLRISGWQFFMAIVGTLVWGFG